MRTSFSTLAAGTWTVTGGIAGGNDTLSGIEFIQHAGGRFVLIDPNPAMAASSACTRQSMPAPCAAGDTIVYAAPPPPADPIVIAFTTSQDLDFTIPYDNPTKITLDGTGTAHVNTGSGDDFIVTGSGNDTIHTGDGNDVVQAGDGSDEIVGGQGGGNDIYDGGDPGANGNTVSYPSATNSVTIDLRETLEHLDLVVRGPDGAPGVPGGPTIGDLLALPCRRILRTLRSATRTVSTSAPTR